MDMSNYIQPNCINGISKEDAEKVTEIPQIQEDIETIQNDIQTITETTIPSIEDDISDLDDRVTILENGSPSSFEWKTITTDDLPLTNIICEYIGSPKYVIKFTTDVIINICVHGLLTRLKFNKDDEINIDETFFDLYGSIADGVSGSAIIKIYHCYMSVSTFFRSISNNFKYNESGFNVFLNDNSQTGYAYQNQSVSISNKLTSGSQIVIMYKDYN